MATQDNGTLFVEDDDFDEVYEDQPNRPAAAVQPTHPPQPAQPENSEIIDISSDDGPETGNQQVPPDEATQQGTARRQEEVVDLTEDGPEMYYLAKFNQLIPKTEVYNRLRKKYADIFKRQSELAMPKTDLKQRMEEIAAKVVKVKIGYLIDRDRTIWRQILLKQRKALQGEHQQVLDFHEKLKRPESQETLENGLLTEVEGRLEWVEKDLRLREKLVEELMTLAQTP